LPPDSEEIQVSDTKKKIQAALDEADEIQKRHAKYLKLIDNAAKELDGLRAKVRQLEPETSKGDTGKKDLLLSVIKQLMKDIESCAANAKVEFEKHEKSYIDIRGSGIKTFLLKKHGLTDKDLDEGGKKEFVKLLALDSQNANAVKNLYDDKIANRTRALHAALEIQKSLLSKWLDKSKIDALLKILSVEIDKFREACGNAYAETKVDSEIKRLSELDKENSSLRLSIRTQPGAVDAMMGSLETRRKQISIKIAQADKTFQRLAKAVPAELRRTNDKVKKAMDELLSVNEKNTTDLLSADETLEKMEKKLKTFA
jgi:hypothetical protein